MTSPLQKFLQCNNIWRERVILYSWTPLRCHAAGRVKPISVVGIKNFDLVDQVYYPIAEVDRRSKLDPKYTIGHLIYLNNILNRCKNIGLKIAFICITRKGYHFYFANKCKSPHKCIYLLRKARVFDKGHLNLAKTRNDKTLVLRVSRKYPEPDIFPIYINQDALTEWHLEVLDLIKMFHGERYDQKEEGEKR